MPCSCPLLATTSTTSISAALRSPRSLTCCRAFSVATPSVSHVAARPRPVARSAARRPQLLVFASPPPVLVLPLARTMSSPAAAPVPPRIFFGPYDVSTQVFYTTPLSFALVNLKPLLPGHVLVCPKRPHRRLTDLDPAELADLFAAVQVVQRMLAAYYFGEAETTSAEVETQVHKGSFNLAIQDGPEAGQTVAHVHVHVLPRIRGATAKDAATEGDALYEKMADEPGNVGGAQWDAAATEERPSSRPRPGGRFPRIEDSSRQARTMEAMEAEAADFRSALAKFGIEQGSEKKE